MKDDVKRSQATLRDVAKAAGVHVSTVSRVLSPETRDLVKDETAGRIEKIVDELGYMPNRLAQGLKTRRSMTVGVLVNDITNPVFPYVVRGIEDRLRRTGYTALVVNTDGDVDRERSALEAFKTQQADGLIVTTALLTDPLVEEVIDEGTPLVLAIRNIDSNRVSAVTPDEHLGTRRAVEHLVDLGHRQIACLSGPTSVSTGAARFAAFKDAAAAFGLKPEPSLMVEAQSFTIGEGERFMGELLDSGATFTAVLAGNDMLAVGCLAAIAARNLNCPGDISVIGFNDMPLAERLSPPLSTMRIPYYEIGELAAVLLIEQMNDQPTRQITVREDLIVRGSTAVAAR